MFQRSPDAVSNDIHSYYREIFLDPRGGSYTRNLYRDFATIPDFNPTRATIRGIAFQVNEHGSATIDDIRIATGDSAPSPDLVVSALNISDPTPNVDQLFNINATVKNIGDGSSSSGMLRYYRSTDAKVTMGDVQLASHVVGSLSAGQSSSESQAVSIDSVGRFWVGACIDPISGELSTANNCSVGVEVTMTDSKDVIVVALEEPAANSTVSGVGNLRGWAVGPDGIDRVEFYVDGVLKKEIPYGGARGDVANAYPNYPESRYSGYSSAYAYGMLTPGTHTLKVRAVSAAGKYKEASNTFEVTRFHKGYFSDPKAMDIVDSSVSQDGKRILLDNIKVEGQTYDVRLAWQVPSQQFGIVDIVTENIAGISWTANSLQLSRSLLPAAAQAIDDRIVVALEEPAANSTVSGVGNLRGWAVGPDGIDHVEFYVDGVLKKEIPYGGARGDVANAYPNYPESRYSGYSSAYAYGMLTPGTHTLKVRAVSAAGKYKEASNTFKVTRFHKGYFSDPKAMDITDSSVSQDGTGILLNDIEVEGITYDVRLEWQVPSQQFGIVDIATE